MTGRKILVYSTSVIAVIGIIFFITPFIFSLEPSEAAKSSLFEVDISGLDTGDYIEVDDPYGFKILILKDWANSFKAFMIPFDEKEKHYMLPDIRWLTPFVPCQNFGPEIIDGKLKKNGQIKCFDESLVEWWKNEFKWNYSGENLGSSVQDLPIPKYVISNNIFKQTGRGWVVE